MARGRRNKRLEAMKTYDILKVFFKFRIFGITVQFRKLHMNSKPSGETLVFTVSTDAVPRG